jgi:hypothetical protein
MGKTRRIRKALLYACLGLLFMCLLTGGISALANRNLPTRSAIVEQLAEDDKRYLLEAIHLRQTLGERVWPGWGQADIPMILYNESYAFLTGLDRPFAGWVKVPEASVRGGAWVPLADDTLAGQTYYRQPVADAARTIGAFTVKVGERWVAAFDTHTWSQISFHQGFYRELPPVVREVFPYTLAWRFLMGEGDRYITALSHEAFHAYEGILLPAKLIAAEQSSRLAESYPWDNASSEDAWQAELDLLDKAVQARAEREWLDLAGQFLHRRQERRAAMALAPALVDYERQQEWMEGLAKYAELTSGLIAATDSTYRPSIVIPGFKGYGEDYVRFYQMQLREVSRIHNRPGNTRFYCSGMAQAVLLDRLNPAWKPLAMQSGTYLEDILADTLVHSVQANDRGFTLFLGGNAWRYAASRVGRT